MIAALFTALAAAQAQPESPRAFLERVYAGYREPDFSPLADPDRLFAPPLAEAIREDARLSIDEVGLLDGDPLCQCQDASGLRPRIEALSSAGPDRATARILLRLPGYPARDLRLRLVRTPSGWRVADVAAPGSPSLLRDLRRSNRRRR